MIKSYNGERFGDDTGSQSASNQKRAALPHFFVVDCHVTPASLSRTEVKMVSYNNAKMVDESHDK